MNQPKWRPDEIRPVRRSGLVMRRAGDQLNIWSPGREYRCTLNSSAALVWLFCDGKLTVSEIERWLHELYPEQAALISRQLPDLIDSLLRQELVSTQPSAEEPRPLIKVAFQNFWMGFDIEDNYFLWMLSSRADVMIVDQRVDTPDLVFFSEEPGTEGWLYDSDEVFRILVDREGEAPDSESGDFVFHLGGDKPRFEKKAIWIPKWVTKVHWTRYEPDSRAGRLIEDSEIPRPEVFSDHMWASLQTVKPRRLGVPQGIVSAVTPPSQHEKPGSHRALKKLTIGVPTYDDFDGVYFTLMALRAYHQDVAEETEILIVDNNPDGPCGESLERLARRIRACRYYPNPDAKGTAVTKDLIFQLATTPYVMCIDGHVLLPPRSIRRLIDYLDENPDCYDLVQGPLLHDNMKSLSTHFKPVWSNGMYGQWAFDDRGRNIDSPPFEIQMQGMGLFACRRDAWLGFNPRFRGFGGEEGYIHEKFRQAGRKAVCLPFLRWVHRFDRPTGVKYTNTHFDRIRNYTIGFRELGLDDAPIESHFREFIGDDKFEDALERIQKEMEHPFFQLDGIYWIGSNGDMAKTVEQRLDELGLSRAVRRYGPAGASNSFSEFEYLKAHRSAIEAARDAGLDHVIMCSDNCFLSDSLEQTPGAVRKSIDQLTDGELDVVRIGDPPFAAAFSRSLYGLFLNDLPSEESDYEDFVSLYGGFAAYLKSLDDRVTLEPVDGSMDPDLVAVP